MKLKKVEGVYHAQFRTATGARRMISTKQTDHASAKAVVQQAGIAEMERAAMAGKLSREVVGRILTGKRTTVAKAIEPFREWMRSRGRSPKTIAENTITINAWMREMKLESLPPSAVTETHIAIWINDPGKKRGQRSRKVALCHIHMFFAFGCANGWIAADPSQAIDIDYNVLSHYQKEARERLPFTPEELERLKAYLETEMRIIGRDMKCVEQAGEYTVNGRAVKLGKLGGKHAKLFFWLFAVRCSSTTGARLSDIASLEWRCFGEPGKIVVWMDKTNQRIEHALAAELETMVMQIAVDSPTHLFPEQNEIIRDVQRRSLLSIRFKRICERLGIKGKSYHCTRHAAASEKYHAIDNDELAKRLAETLSMTQIKQLLGHSSAKTSAGFCIS
jgi:integrase